jgi:hypothetical protein
MRTREQIRDDMISQFEVEKEITIKTGGYYWTTFDVIARALALEWEKLDKRIKKHEKLLKAMRGPQ